VPGALIRSGGWHDGPAVRARLRRPFAAPARAQRPAPRPALQKEAARGGVRRTPRSSVGRARWCQGRFAPRKRAVAQMGDP
jgi:hypothetical protein